MLIYLVQHGDAKREKEDPSRPLSEKGIRDVEHVASHISRLNIEVKEVLHSSKLRAKQTAEIMAEKLKIEKGISETDGLAPLDDASIWEERLKKRHDSLMLVGHLPHLGKLASLLLCGDKERNVISFKMGGIVCLKRDDAGSWSLQWMITPETLIW
jgi:phosphohistidine phosphatase